MIFMILVMLINGIYPLYVTYYVCENFNPHDTVCLKIGVLYYIEFDNMINVLRLNNDYTIIAVNFVLTIFVDFEFSSDDHIRYFIDWKYSQYTFSIQIGENLSIKESSPNGR